MLQELQSYLLQMFRLVFLLLIKRKALQTAHFIGDWRLDGPMYPNNDLSNRPCLRLFCRLWSAAVARANAAADVATAIGTAAGAPANAVPPRCFCDSLMCGAFGTFCYGI